MCLNSSKQALQTQCDLGIFTKMGWLSGLAWCSAGFSVLGVTFGALLFAFQDKLLYLPSVPFRDPDDNPHGESASMDRSIE